MSHRCCCYVSPVIVSSWRTYVARVDGYNRLKECPIFSIDTRGHKFRRQPSTSLYKLCASLPYDPSSSTPIRVSRSHACLYELYIWPCFLGCVFRPSWSAAKARRLAPARRFPQARQRGRSCSLTTDTTMSMRDGLVPPFVALRRGGRCHPSQRACNKASHWPSLALRAPLRRTPKNLTFDYTRLSSHRALACVLLSEQGWGTWGPWGWC